MIKKEYVKKDSSVIPSEAYDKKGNRSDKAKQMNDISTNTVIIGTNVILSGFI